MSDVHVIDLVQYASENKPVDFTAALDAILGKKAVDALADRKQQIAASLFKDSEEAEESNEEDSEQDLEDAEVDSEEDETEIEDEESEESGETDDQS